MNVTLVIVQIILAAGFVYSGWMKTVRIESSKNTWAWVNDVPKSLVVLMFPASAFLYVTNGNATVILDGNEHATQPFYMLHGGKNTRLDIIPTDESFHYYLIFYKASLPLWMMSNHSATCSLPSSPMLNT